ncbi:hypothetical protein [Chimaeribacter arupi]|uniref:hypothetical protein n=1 Tax=Chimaeribacter arupi TaxID=2060066 RepID=UPI000C7CDCC7|nr:hypothetical protein [Chimaeribacter arupi]PLR52392.1 hypothetical protein CYR52_07490 [Chimaeribacter arupi]
MTLKKLDVESYAERQKELSEIFTVDDTHIVINIPDTDAQYEIARDTCTSGAQVVSWIFQLTEKNWMTREMLRHFIKIASREANITL